MTCLCGPEAILLRDEIATLKTIVGDQERIMLTRGPINFWCGFIAGSLATGLFCVFLIWLLPGR